MRIVKAYVSFYGSADANIVELSFTARDQFVVFKQAATDGGGVINVPHTFTFDFGPGVYVKDVAAGSSVNIALALFTGTHTAAAAPTDLTLNLVYWEE